MSSAIPIQKLLLLTDAESADVRRHAVVALAEHGERALRQALQERGLGPERMFALEEALREARVAEMRARWLGWSHAETAWERLELALSTIADLQAREPLHPGLSDLLDDLVGEFSRGGRKADLFALNRFLFREWALRGNEEDYYNPLNSNLVWVLQEKRGLPISLVSIFVLCAARLGLEVHGFNFPGHFLAMSRQGNQLYFFDCFNGGKLLDTREIATLYLSAAGGESGVSLERPTAPHAIVARVLSNLVNAYQKRDEPERAAFFREMLAELHAEQRARGEDPRTPLGLHEARFRPGAVVRHNRYGYRGVIVDVDPYCMAPEAWRQSTPTRPLRDQPWYHVLVDESKLVTYAAQSNLDPDPSEAEVRHPLVAEYFEDFQAGRYTRNDRPWS